MSGFCGSCTTFATWQLEVAKTFISGDVVLAFVRLFTTFSGSFICFRFGKHVGTVFRTYKPANKVAPAADDQEKAIAIRDFWVQLIIISVGFLLCTSGIWCTIFLAHLPSTQQETVSLAFAPFGAALRYLLSLFNYKFPRFPLFTFIPNIFGTLVNAAVSIVLNSSLIPADLSGSFQLWLGWGVSAGMMGALSTVSTWIKEIDTLSERKELFHWAYLYGLVSVICAQAVGLALIGSWVATDHSV